jgi:UDP-N-acetylglucosamine acyltransferase
VTTHIDPRALIHPTVKLADGVTVGPFASIGEDVVNGAPSYLRIGDDNDIRELAVIHRSAIPGGYTVIGSHTFIMSQAHVAHDCILADRAVIASLTALAGHVEVEEGAMIGGVTGVHQFVRIGAYSMVGGSSRLVQDVPPYMIAAGNPATVHGLNVVGLRRAGFSPDLRRELKAVHRTLYRSDLNVSQALDTIQRQPNLSAPVRHVVRFIEASKRGICS